MGSVNLLLDTCTLIWLALPNGKLSATVTGRINDPANNLFLSDVSIWEICLKHTIGKLPLPETPRQWLPPQLEFFQIQALPLNRGAIFRSGELPPVHRDPFDRLLAAQAIEADMTILSPDTPFLSLGASCVS